MYIFIIIEKNEPVCFLMGEIYDEFKHDKYNFIRINSFQGDFYSFHTFTEKDTLYLAKIDFEFSEEDNLSLIETCKQTPYIETSFTQFPGHFYIRIKMPNIEDKIINEEKKFSELFGFDSLFYNGESKLFCFCFGIPNEIKLMK